MTRPAALMILGAILALPGDARAQQGCAVSPVAQSWSQPLNRRISFRARDISLREAIDRVAAAGRFRVSYSAEFLPLDRRVCVAADSVVAGDVLAALLSGVSVSPVVTSADQVVIAPARLAPPAQRESVQTLDRVVVTGSAGGIARRPLTVAIGVIDRQEVEKEPSGTLAASFDGRVAGMWLWEQSPASLLARYGSIRGASSFGLSHPKVYIDGIEVANPLLVTDLNPASLDRVEVIRGPQGAALYGADAISGVVNIVTRHDGVHAGAGRAEFSSRAGFSQTSFAERSALAQSHSLSWRAGSSMRSGSLGMSVSTLGGYVPEAFSRDVKLDGAFRVVTQTAAVTGIARVSAKRAAIGENPLVAGLAPAAGGAPAFSRVASFALDAGDSLPSQRLSESLPQTVRHYTVGVTSTLLSGTTWVPSFSAGIDGYRLANVPNESVLIPSALDSALSSAEGGASRLTFRTSVVGQFDVGARRSLTLTFSGEHSNLHEMLSVATLNLSGSGAIRVDSASSRGNTGLVGQANLALNDAFYITAGGRLEQNHGFTSGANTVVLPMFGVATVRDAGALTVKTRAAYGVGVRPARSAARGIAFTDARHYGRASSLDPERQSGVEFGADLFFARRLAVHITRFDQTASGLIQSVAISGDSVWASGAHGSSNRPDYVLQNVGAITNRGWEVETSFDLGTLAVSGAFTQVDSRVQRIARGYEGDLRPGDRVLGVPAATASLSTSWQLFGWRAGLTASRAFDWINYDRLRIAQDFASCDSCGFRFEGPLLRNYWKRYGGVTRLRASFSRELPRGLGVRVTADNLTNVQRGEPDNVTVLPGRTILLGMSAKIR